MALLAPVAHAEVRWLCSPALSADPCRGDLTTRVFAPDGSSTVEHPAVAADPNVDCFYVYPTTSGQPTVNAAPTADPEIRSIATYQAQRFSAKCRVFVPLYRQVTLAGVAIASQTRTVAPYDTALVDVREAFRQFLEEIGPDRGFLLVGHSQGSRMLRALIRRDIDPDPALRRRLVSAIIPGANATVAKGRDAGGDFEHVPACRSAGQTGCVISYSTFNATPPATARFGRTKTDPVGRALDLPVGGDTEVLCSDVAALSGSGGRLEPLLPSEPFAPGIAALGLLRLFGGPPPTADTPWLAPADRYTARCVSENGFNVLRITPDGPVRQLTPTPDDTWGVHIADLNLPLGNLLKIVDDQIASSTGGAGAGVAAASPVAPTVRLGAVRAGRTHRRLSALVRGEPGASVRLTLVRRSGLVARRTFTLSALGLARSRVRVARAGRYRAFVRSGPGGKVVRSSVKTITLR